MELAGEHAYRDQRDGGACDRHGQAESKSEEEPRGEWFVQLDSPDLVRKSCFVVVIFVPGRPPVKKKARRLAGQAYRYEVIS